MACSIKAVCKRPSDSALAALGMLHPQAFGALNCVKPFRLWPLNYLVDAFYLTLMQFDLSAGCVSNHWQLFHGNKQL